MTPKTARRLPRLLQAAVALAGLAAGPALAQAPTPSVTPGSADPVPPAEVQDHGATGHDAVSPGAVNPGAAGRSARTPAPDDAYNYIGWPQDGTVIRSTRVKVWFGARNVGVAPAGVVKPGTGHHHLLIDVPLPDDMTVPIPNDRNHLHFGLGQTETVLELPPGTHTLQLLMGDAAHIPHDPPIFSRRVTVHVRPGPAARAVSAQAAVP